MTATSEARRYRQSPSYKFLKNYYEDHKDEEREKKPKKIKVQELDKELPPVPFQQYTGSTVLDAWSGRRVIEWMCTGPGGDEKRL